MMENYFMIKLLQDLDVETGWPNSGAFPWLSQLWVHVKKASVTESRHLEECGRIPEFICSSDEAAAITPHEFYSVLLLFVLGK